MTKNWFKDWFASEEYLKVYNHRDSKDAKNLCDLIIQTINPGKKDFIIDAACGAGRHGLYLSSKGYNITGFDLSKTLLDVAKEKSVKKKNHINLIRADIREIIFKRKIFAVLNLFTSFGYFDTDEENFRFAKHAAGFVKENGFYVLDFFNKKYIENNLVPESKRVEGDLTINEKRYFEGSRVIKKISLLRNSRQKEFVESVLLYEPEFIINSFIECGFSVYKIYGDYHGSEYNEQNSPRLLIFFKR